MSFPRYPEYKASGVEWLGNVPAHWKVDRIKASVRSCRNGIWGDEAAGDEDDLPCVRVADFDRVRLVVADIPPTIRKVTAREREGRLLTRGTLLLEKSGGGEGQPVGCVVLYAISDPAVCSNFMARMELREGMVPSFWRYVHAAAYSIRLTTGSINQTSGIQNLDQDRYFNESAAYPPQPEQTAIAAFLDRETAKIDALVAEQEKLIALLKEKRQAVISHAVTKGLNPDAPMKPSGIEWLGDVPVHWSLQQFRRCVFIAEGQVDPEADQYRTMPLVAPNHVESGTGRLTETETAEEQAAESGKYLCQAGDVIYSKIRPALRKVCLAPSDCLCSADMYPLRPYGQLLNEYLLWFILSEQFSSLAVLESERVAMPKINRETLNEVPMLLPPLIEQHRISDHIKSAVGSIDRLVNAASEAITLLKERRSALISAAVTGQIDVRDALAGTRA